MNEDNKPAESDNAQYVATIRDYLQDFIYAETHGVPMHNEPRCLERDVRELCDRLEAAEKEKKELKYIISTAPGSDEEEFDIKYNRWWDLHYRELRTPGCNGPRPTFDQLEHKIDELEQANAELKKQIECFRRMERRDYYTCGRCGKDYHTLRIMGFDCPFCKDQALGTDVNDTDK